MSAELLQSLLSNIWSIFLVILFFGGSIFVHELGHFLAARKRGVHVTRFSIGFGPKICAWTGKDGVEYRLSWLPLGGYVALPQLADMRGIEGDNDVDPTRLEPISYLSKMIVFGAGAFFNVLFAFFLACLVWWLGNPTFADLATNKIGNVQQAIKLPDGTSVRSPAMDAGLQAGDEVVSIDGTKVANFEEIITAVFLGNDRASDGQRRSTFVINRNGKRIEAVLYPRLVSDENIRSVGIEPAEDLTVDALIDGWAAAAAGVKPNDRLLALDGNPVFQRVAVSDYLAKNPTRPVEFTFEREGKIIKLPIQARLESDDKGEKKVPRVGIRYRDVVVITHPTPIAQISADVMGTFRTLGALLSPGSDIGPSKLSGPIGIAREFHRQAQWDFRRVLWFTILVNVNLAVFNLLPVPILDGGHMLFATIARLRGRALPLNFIMTTQSVFMVLLFSMIIYVSLFGDLRRWIRDVKAEHVEAPAVAPVKAK